MPDDDVSTVSDGLKRRYGGHKGTGGGDDVSVVLNGVVAAVRERAGSDDAFRGALVRLLGLSGSADEEQPPSATADHQRASRSFNEFFDADLVAKRCRLKAAAARWQTQRESLDREAVRPGDELILNMGRDLPDCYLWMCNVSKCRTRSEAAMQRVAAAYEALAEAADLVGPVDLATLTGDSTDPSGDHVQLVAEAQSMLHVVLGDVRTGGGFDADQMSAYVLAKEVGGRRRTFFHFLARDDRADPTTSGDLRQRIADADLDAPQRTQARVSALLLHLRQIIDGAAESVDAADTDLAWARYDTNELVAAGLSAEDHRLTSAVAGLISRIPTDADDSILGGPLADALDQAESQPQAASPAVVRAA